MAQEGFKRKLTAILSADVVGYSRLMEDNEQATIQTLNIYRNSMSALIQQHRGRVVDTTGDNLMADFSSVVDAVMCAVETQKELSERNADLPENRRMLFRIGVNLGDIVEEGDKIYGDGVNIAARLEGLAEAGGICISRTAYDQVKNKLDLGYEYLGEHSVKNILEPVHVYKVLVEPEAAGKVIGEKRKEKRRMVIAAVIVLLIGVAGLAGWYLYIEQAKRIEPASVENMAYPLPDKPSIAVLPFVNMSGNPEQSYFSDGITEHIITSLSKVPYIFVIARNSTFAYKGKSVKIQQIAEELAVRYVLEGSVQRSDGQVRITVQLIDAIAGHHIWAENYDRKLTDIFALQDEIAIKIMAQIQVELTAADLGRLSPEKASNIKSYEKFLKGSEHLYRRTEADVLEARKLAQEAISLDPEYRAPYLLLGWTHLDDIWFLRTKDRVKSLQTAEQLAQKAIDLSGQDDATHRLLSCVFLLRKQYEKAIVEAQKAVEFAPNSAQPNFIYGMVLKNADRYDEAIPVLKKAIRLNPVTPINYLNNLAWSYAYSEQYEKAIPLWNKAIERNPDYLFAYMGLTCAYQLTGDGAKAREAAAELLRIKPIFSVKLAAKIQGTKNAEIKKRIFAAYRKAGIPENSSQKVSD
jgi:adenylate cyclase